ncbi:MAG: hypothetical protein LBT83_12270 [Tannerella sp.]|jgi:hypothetical protein|nr:hypothetical protein [Tannerella sp.]
MKTKLIFIIAIMVMFTACQRSLPVIVCSDQASATERLAVKELRRYLYLRTGELAEIRESSEAATRPSYAIELHKDDALGEECYQLKTSGRQLRIVGGSDKALLYGVYKFAEHLGIRFYLHGDVVPDEQLTAFVMPKLDETHAPLFATRGIQPFHDFPEGPDWWTSNAYKAVLAQLPKMGMNFIGFHNYPHPEPMIWMGMQDDMDDAGLVKTAYPARHFYTMEYKDWNWGWSYHTNCRTSDYSFGASQWYPKDVYGPVYMDGKGCDTINEAQNIDLYNTSAAFFGDVFAYARQMGVKVCIGTETPMGLSEPSLGILKKRGLNLNDTATVRRLYEGTFAWVKKHYAVDYYWLWTHEGWTWGGNTQKDIDAVVADMQAALGALKNVNAGFGLATCGWVLGPQQDRALFDNYLPKTIPFSCINREVGYAPLDPGFTSIAGRPKWAIPWLEDDPSMIVPQLWAGRMRRDAADALAYGCDGLIGIHWRTQTIAPNIAALAKAGWEQQPWNTTQGQAMTRAQADANALTPERDLDARDFYTDWALSEFGAEVGAQMAEIFLRLDGTTPEDGKTSRKVNLPTPATWVDGPGSVRADELSWSERKADYAFVDEIEALRPLVKGAGNMARFDYWLNQFRYLRATGELSCTWGVYYYKQIKAVREAKQEEKQALAKSLLLPLRIQMVNQMREVHRHLFAAINTYGELGNLTNWQQHNINLLLVSPEAELKELLGEELPPEAYPDATPVYTARIIAPEVRSVIDRGETLDMTVIITDDAPVSAVLKYRPLGRGGFLTADLQHIDRRVYQATLPSVVTDDFEYYIEVQQASGATLRYPATAPDLNQTVVVVDNGK